MSAAANYAFANRQMITHWVRETFENVLGIGRGKLGLGLVYDVEQTDAIVNVDMTLTSPACPVGPQIMQQAKMALERLDDVEEAKIQLVMSPAWSPDRMTDDARDQLGIF